MKPAEWIIAAVAAWLIWAGVNGGGVNPFDPPQPPPIPGNGFRVLILEETADRDKLPREQAAILRSTVIRGYLNAKCAKAPDGKTPEYRILDDDLTPELLKFERPNFAEAFAKAKTDSQGKTPWLVVSNGETGTSRPLPVTVDETLKILKQYGGE